MRWRLRWVLWIVPVAFAGLIFIGCAESQVTQIVDTAEVEAVSTTEAMQTPGTPEELAFALVAALLEGRCDDVAALIRPDFRDHIMGSGSVCGPKAALPLVSSRIDYVAKWHDPDFEGETIVSVIGEFERSSSWPTDEIRQVRECRVWVEQREGKWYILDWAFDTWRDSPPAP